MSSIYTISVRGLLSSHAKCLLLLTEADELASGPFRTVHRSSA